MAGFGKQGKSQPGGGTKATAPTRDHGVPGKGNITGGNVGPTAPVNVGGKGNNDKNKAK